MGMWIIAGLSITMSVVFLFLNTGMLALIPVIISTLEAFIVNFIASLIIPADKLGKMFAKKCGAKEKSFIFATLNNLIICGIYVTIVSFIMTLINVGFLTMLFLIWLSIYPIVFGVGYIISLLITPLAFKLNTQIVEH